MLPKVHTDRQDDLADIWPAGEGNLLSALPLHLRWVKGNRYYHVLMQRDLFGYYVITREWGSFTRRGGQQQVLPMEEAEQARVLLLACCKRRRVRGYMRVER